MLTAALVAALLDTPPVAPREAAGTGTAVHSLDMLTGSQPEAGIPDHMADRAVDKVGTAAGMARLNSAGRVVDTADKAGRAAVEVVDCPSSCCRICWGKQL